MPKVRFDPAALLRREYWMAEERSLVAAALVIGLLSGASAAVLVWMIGWIGQLVPTVTPGEHPSLWIVFVPAIGGLLVGPIVT
ncbi:hypothetical protein K8I85_10760, partial [bacterium]|nr:hypothetical protein [bacterium]